MCERETGSSDAIKALYASLPHPDPNLPRHKYLGLTCTMLAADNGHVDVLRYLVDVQGAKCDDTIRSNGCMTCAMFAARKVAALEYLVDERGVRWDETIRDNDGDTATDLAKNAWQNRGAMVAYLQVRRKGEE